MRAMMLEGIALFLLGGLVVAFVFFIRAAWRNAEANERLTRENESLRRENEELRRRAGESK